MIFFRQPNWADSIRGLGRIINLKQFSRFLIWLMENTVQSWHYLITLSALASTFCGIVTPICFAVLRLITSSNFVGCSTGKSAGLAPFRIL
jgi:hypothetical protein